jgi:hypothetical protein
MVSAIVKARKSTSTATPDARPAGLEVAAAGCCGTDGCC